MRILLLGEFSGVHQNLKEGLLELGHDVVIVANGDGFKNITSDFQIGNNSSGFKGKISRIIWPILNQKILKNNDVVQFINPEIFSKYIEQPTLKYILNNNEKSFLLGAGCDYYFYKVAKQYQYSPCFTCERYDKKTICNWNDKRHQEINNLAADNVNGVIPLLYEYAEAYRRNRFNNVRKTIPFPLNVSKIKYKNNIVKGKIVIFHGLNREGFKGTKLIKEAMEYLRNKYPNDLEIVIDGKMPLQRYLAVIDKANIIIDQCNSLSYGMNAVYAMAQGKVVFSGAELECLREFEIDNCPIVNIKPDINDIVKKIEIFIEQKSLIEKIGYESRLYVENTHNYLSVAQQYCKEWKK